MKCLLIDDDPLICDLIEHFCGKVKDISAVTTTNSGFESTHLLNSHDYDVIFLDYNLPDLVGSEILKMVRKETAVIMITSNKDFASESYNYDQVVDFLVKPVDFSRFFKALEKARTFLSGLEKGTIEQLFIKEGNRLVKLNLQGVWYFKSEANYVSIVSDEKKIMSLMTLKDLEVKLPHFFQRVHRSFIVNINKISAIEQNMLEIGAHQIPISQSYEKELLNKIKLLN